MNFDFNQLQADIFGTIQAYLSRVAAATIILLLGWLISRLLRYLTFRILQRISRVRFLEEKLKDYSIHEATLKGVSIIVFWLSFLLVIASAGKVLGLPVITGSLSKLASYLPNLLAAVLVVVAGIVLGGIVRAAVSSTARSAKIPHAGFMGEGTRFAIIVVSVMIALSQIGIDSTVLVVAFGLVLGGTVTGISLAFGFGARTSVSNLLAARNISNIILSNMTNSTNLLV